MKLSQQDFMNANMIMPTHYPPGEGCGCSGCLTVFIVCAIISFISDHYKEILIISGIILVIALAFFLIKSHFENLATIRKENRQNKCTTFLKESKNVEANENDKDEKKSIKERRKEAREHDKQILKEREEKKKRRYKKKKNTDN